MTHTPGPWYCDGSEVYLEENVCIAIAYCPRMDDEGTRMPHAQVLANAQLMAAAPELLEALRAVRSAHAHVESANMPAWLDMAEEAIAKAAGRSE